MTSTFNTQALGQQRFLAFPAISGRYGPFTSGLMTSVLDHDVPHDLTVPAIPFKEKSDTGPFGFNGKVLTFTGELFSETIQYVAKEYQCYPKASDNYDAVWSSVLKNSYVGTSGFTSDTGCHADKAVNYDNHPGYDFSIPEGTAIYPAASGVIIPTKCIKTFANNSSCDDYGAIAVDHKNGFITQYLHLRSVNYGQAINGKEQQVEISKYVLGFVSNVGIPKNGAHLHFEVLQRKSVAVDVNNYYARANYMIVDPYGYKPKSKHEDKLLSKPGCLWIEECRY